MGYLPHNWVEVRVIPVSAELIDGQFRFYASEEAVEIAEEDLHYMCYACKCHPGDEEALGPCPGARTESVLDDQ